MKKIMTFLVIPAKAGIQTFLITFTFLLFSHAFATDKNVLSVPTPLPISQAFILNTQLGDNNQVILNWKIAPGHYLYRDKFNFVLTPTALASLGKISLPAGEKKYDEILGNYQVYKNKLSITLPIENLSNIEEPLNLQATYQGCTAWGYCYPPIIKTIKLDFNSHNASFDLGENISKQDKVTQLLKNKDYLEVLLGFLGFGLLLAFTPCVLPMIPILSGIIANQQKKVIAHKAFLLSLTYVLSMSFTYAGIGVLVSLMGNNIQAALQTPWALILGSLLFVLLALSLFGFYELKLPHRLHHRIYHLSSRQKGGNFLSVAIMGCLATLIVSPCVTPPLVGALTYIAASGNTMLGASALFLMGFGMGIPLLILGMLGGKFLPKAGPWMETIRCVLGVLMLAVALQLISRIIPGPISLALWGCLLIGCAIFMGGGKLRKTIALILFIEGSAMLIGADMGNDNPLQPLANMQLLNQQRLPFSLANTENFKSMKSLEEALAAIRLAKIAGQPVLIDFYADWCVSCKKMDQEVFGNPNFRNLLNRFTVLRVDVTRNNEEDQTLEHYFHVVAPPTLIFFDANGQALPQATLVGEIKPKALMQHLESIVGAV